MLWFCETRTTGGTMKTDNSDIMTVDEVAQFLKLSKITIYKLVKQEKLPGFRVGNSWRFRREDIMEAVNR